MTLHATTASIYARRNRLSIFSNFLKGSACIALILAATGSRAYAQVPAPQYNMPVGGYYMPDPTDPSERVRTTDLKQALDAWRNDAEFKRNFGVGAIKSEYAYALGLTGSGIKLGVFDNGTWRAHSEFTAPDKLQTITTTGIRAYTDPYVLAKKTGRK